MFKVLTAVEIHLSLANLKILKAEKKKKRETERDQESYRWKEFFYLSKEMVNACGISL